MMFARASEATLMGMKVAKASRAWLESGFGKSRTVQADAQRTLLANLEQLVCLPGDYAAW